MAELQRKNIDIKKDTLRIIEHLAVDVKTKNGGRYSAKKWIEDLVEREVEKTQ